MEPSLLHRYYPLIFLVGTFFVILVISFEILAMAMFVDDVSTDKGFERSTCHVDKVDAFILDDCEYDCALGTWYVTITIHSREVAAVISTAHHRTLDDVNKVLATRMVGHRYPCYYRVDEHSVEAKWSLTNYVLSMVVALVGLPLIIILPITYVYLGRRYI